MLEIFIHRRLRYIVAFRYINDIFLHTCNNRFGINYFQFIPESAAPNEKHRAYLNRNFKLRCSVPSVRKSSNSFAEFIHYSINQRVIYLDTDALLFPDKHPEHLLFMLRDIEPLNSRHRRYIICFHFYRFHPVYTVVNNIFVLIAVTDKIIFSLKCKTQIVQVCEHLSWLLFFYANTKRVYRTRHTPSELTILNYRPVFR